MSSSRETFLALQTWLADCRALASPDIVIILVGNKSDISTSTTHGLNDKYHQLNGDVRTFEQDFRGGEVAGGFHKEREVSVEEAGRWASREGTSSCPHQTTPFFFLCFVVCGVDICIGIGFLEASALDGTNVDEAFLRCARQILTKVELGTHNSPSPTQLSLENLSSYIFVL